MNGARRHTSADEEFDVYLEGRRLYGDDFGPREIEAWYEDERNGYADLTPRGMSAYRYTYHALNRYHGFRYLRKPWYRNVLAFGGAYGDEILPIIERIGALTIVDPSDAFAKESVHGKSVRYVRPAPSGVLQMESDSFDLVTCLGVVHHIPNVSTVVREIGRVLQPGGCLILREPIISMGDWRMPRRGLTKRERGIPLKLLEAFVLGAGLAIDRVSFCAFPISTRVFSAFGRDAYNSDFAVRIDSCLARMFGWNLKYHARRSVEKLRPTAAYVVARKAAIIGNG
jgi:SAM-dependent methyltransferase